MIKQPKIRDIAKILINLYTSGGMFLFFFVVNLYEMKGGVL